MKKLLVVGLTALLLVGCNVGGTKEESVKQDAKQVTTETPNTEATTEQPTTEATTTEVPTTEMATIEIVTEAPQTELATTEGISTEAANDMGVTAVEAVRKHYQEELSASNPSANVDFELSEYSPEQDLAGTYYLVKAIDKNKKTANLLQSFKYYEDGNIVAE